MAQPPTYTIDLDAREWFVVRTRCTWCGFQAIEAFRTEQCSPGALARCSTCDGLRSVLVTHFLAPGVALRLRDAFVAIEDACDEDREGEPKWLPNLWVVENG